MNFEEQIVAAASSLIQSLSPYNTTVSRKLEEALNQSSQTESTEQYQYVGVLVRDSWIEFTQSIFRVEFVPSGEPEPSQSDVKRMLKYTLHEFPQMNKFLLEASEATYDFSLKLQHDLSATKQMALSCTTETIVCMAMILNCALQANIAIKRPYYKCPDCGSIKLETGEEWERDIEGAFKVKTLTCNRCGWQYIDYPDVMTD